IALAVLALAVALLAAGAAGFSWWQNAARDAALETSRRETLKSLDNALEAVRTASHGSAERVHALDETLAAERQRVTEMASRLDGLPERLGALEQRVEAGSGSADARTEWLRSEADYYLGLANSELELGGRWQTAIAALELADDRLRKLSDPSLGPVRQAVADELVELKSVKLPDLEGIAFRLEGLAAHLDELPFRSPGPNAHSAKPLDDSQPGLDRLWHTFEGAVAGIVSVRRSDEPASQVLTSDERLLARRQLALDLELARAAALNAEPKAYAASLDNAAALLQRDFDRGSAAVAAASALLIELHGIDIAPQRPDISASLKQLRQLGEGH
ncbi:MAG TPA: uroporphyrinogen-III C-methyltransferase, partial [Gammaproteobacteria bacterium]|nr:uroporphyrinogen-III C-methyltransferase [Gammaproteobacteria bacterium]